MISKEEVLSVVREKGPVLPRDVVKEVGGDTFLTGAVLSQLVDSKIIRISHAKIGGSPVYYVHGQESKLDILYKFLHEKEKKAYDRLKQETVLRDKIMEPVIRVALRNIRDFAKPLEVNIAGNKEIFWKWHLASNEEAEKVIRQELKSEIPQKQEKRVGEETPPEQNKTEPSKPPEQKEPEQKETQRKLEETSKSEQDDDFLSKIKKIFEAKEIDILKTDIIRKNKDIDLVILVPTPVGKVRFYCKAKDKKKTNDKDLSSLFVDGQMKKMAVLYVTTGELTKKAEEKLGSDFMTVTVMLI